MSDYFSELGRQTAAILARSPAARAQLRQFADGAIGRHVSGMMARDSMPTAGRVRRNLARDQEEKMPMRGGQNYHDPNDQNGETITAEEAQQELQDTFNRLDPAARPAMLAALAQFLEEHQDEAGSGGSDPDLDQTNGGAVDRGFRGGRSGRRGARDNLNPALDARLAAKNNSDFNKRWAGLGDNITVLG